MATPIEPPIDTFPIFQEIFQKIADAVPPVIHFFKSLVGTLVGISIPVSVFLVIGIIYCVEGLKKIRDKESLIHDLKVEPAFEDVPAGDMTMAHQWEKALQHVESANENDWKQAIIDADILLDDLLNKMGYRGESVGEKLKRVASGDMKSLNEAWEAHKVRNQIAHEPGFVLSQYQARQAIGMYRKVFEEFYYI